ncbi:MAG: Rpn family recombination-promoting nuclease/putative transposase [Candidatus Riflebacteria bacterium]|nr:Rpn family recombination-promoting nuclease/putative transposase [Candidatus Riflebacteria bacterium]
MSGRKLVSFDWAMKKLLRSKANFEVLEGFLSELLREPITIIDILEGEGNKESRIDKTNRLDLKTKNAKNEIIIIEVQYEREFDYFQRILYSSSKTLTEHLSEGQPYSDIVKVISVSILYFDLGHGEDYVYLGRTRFKGIHHNDELKLSPNQQQLFTKQFPHELYPEYYLIKVNSFDDVARNTLDEWIYFLKNGEIKDGFKAQGLKRAKEVFDIMKLPDQERRKYDRYSEDLHYQASMVESSYGVGKIEGRKEGRTEGRAEGRTEGRAEVARNMLAEGLETSFIAKITGLSPDEIETLRNKS